VKAKLGKKMAAYFVQGAMEFVFPGHQLPSIMEPKGAVPKKGRTSTATLQTRARATGRSRTGVCATSPRGNSPSPCRGVQL
jgi:hypothetical protein